MRAHLGYNQLSKKQLKLAQDIAHEQFRKDGLEYARRMQKIFCLALNDEFGFGKDRLMRFIEAVDKISEGHMDDEVFWVHADRRLDQIGIPYPHEDYDKMEVK